MANAFTHYFQTSYLFSSSYYIERNVETLLDFVQTPYFTPEGIEKEKALLAAADAQMILSGLLSSFLNQALLSRPSFSVDILGNGRKAIRPPLYEDLRLVYDTSTIQAHEFDCGRNFLTFALCYCY